MRMAIRAVLFDFDYTLAEPTEGTLTCINYALRAMNLPVVSRERVRPLIGLSLPETYRRITNDDSSTEQSRFGKLFVEQADKTMADSIVMFDTVGPTMQRLQMSGYTLGIVSTKYRRRIETVLTRVELRDSFQVIIGGEDVHELKPDPEALLLAVHRLECDVSNCCYVGDTLVDAAAADAAKMNFIGVTTGVTTRQQFDDAGVKRVIDSLPELCELLPRSV